MRKLMMAMLVVHLLMYIAIGLDVPILRQIIVFIYLSFIPGFVLLKILSLKETSVVDTILFSAGLSIAFLMFVGLLINELYPILGVSQPLSTIPLTITVSLSTLILFFVGYRQDLSENFTSIGRNFIDLKAINAKSAILVLPVILGIIGSLYANVPILLLMIIAIAALYALSVFSPRFISSSSYPLVIFAISMALTIQVLLTSKYIIGYDANSEYYVFKLTATNGYWRLLPAGIYTQATLNYGSMLSVTILPTIYSVLMGISGEMLFKAFYSFVFSLVPVTLFQVYKGQIGKSASILSALFFISGQLVFYGFEPLSLDRQIVGEFLLVLSIFILLNKKISVGKRRLLLIIFGVALVVSHYSLAYLYLAFVLSIYAVSTIKRYSDRILDSKTVFFLFVIAFSWYSYSMSPLSSLQQFLYKVYSRLFTDLASLSARSGWVFGSHPAYGSTVNSAGIINWTLFFMVHFFIVIGVLRLLLKSDKWALDPRYRTLSIMSAVTLLLCLVVPNVGPSLNFTRFYAIALLFLAPCFVLGGATFVDILENVLRRATNQRLLINKHQIGTILLCTLLIGYFLSQSGFVNLVTGAVPLSYSLDLDRVRTSTDRNLAINFYSVYIPDQNVFSAVWLSKYMGEQSTVYADYVSKLDVLTSYGLIPSGRILLLTNTTILEQGAFVYLGQLNVVDGVVITETEPLNTSEISPLLNESNLIYSNGNSEIWRACPPG